MFLLFQSSTSSRQMFKYTRTRTTGTSLHYMEAIKCLLEFDLSSSILCKQKPLEDFKSSSLSNTCGGSALLSCSHH